MIDKKFAPLVFLLAISFSIKAQNSKGQIDSFRLYGDVKVTIDKPVDWKKGKKTIITFFALPNGNTTAQTMGKKMKEGDDWHFDIQHIRAQTRFIRTQLPGNNFVVIYMENDYKSWPSWKQKHPDFGHLIRQIVDSLSLLFPSKHKEVYLNGHSGGGSFIFGYIAGGNKIYSNIARISFIDSDYGYDSTYTAKIRDWMMFHKGVLNVFAYNDSIALLNGKSFVSATGGTWYRSHMMLKDFQGFGFSKTETDSLIIYKSNENSSINLQFFFKKNLDRGIYHTQQVELNGFIHSVLAGTKMDSKNYNYYSRRAYQDLIE